MSISTFIHEVYLVDRSEEEAHQYLGTAFPVAPHGGMLTCRHVVDVDYDLDIKYLGVLDPETGVFAMPDDPIFPSDDEIDLAYLPNALERSKEEFFPILSPERVGIGKDVYTLGSFIAKGGDGTPTVAYFSGNIVNIFSVDAESSIVSMLLPYAIIEGMSGSPVLTYHNGPKVVGLATGSQMQRVVAHEVLEYKDTEREFKETINRIIEFGVAYHAATLVSFLEEIGVTEMVVSDERLDMPGLPR